jgi:hypothetical protein
MKLKDWPKHIEELLRLRPDLAEAHVAINVLHEGATRVQLWDPDEGTMLVHLRESKEFVFLETLEWKEGERPWEKEERLVK